MCSSDLLTYFKRAERRSGSLYMDKGKHLCPESALSVETNTFTVQLQRIMDSQSSGKLSIHWHYTAHHMTAYKNLKKKKKRKQREKKIVQHAQSSKIANCGTWSLTLHKNCHLNDFMLAIKRCEGRHRRSWQPSFHSPLRSGSLKLIYLIRTKKIWLLSRFCQVIRRLGTALY